MIKNLIAYAGHKYKILKKIGNYLPNDFKHYYEPFMGMGVIGLNIIKNHETFGLEKAYFSEINENNINLFNLIKNDPELLINELEPIVTHPLDKEYFFKIRDEFNEDRSLAKYMFVLHNSFGSRPDFNKQGNFKCGYANRCTTKPNVLQNRMKTFEKNISDINEVLNLVDVEIALRDYYDFKDFYLKTQSDSGNNFVVLDPPYSGSGLNYNQNQIKSLDNLNRQVFDDLTELNINDSSFKCLVFDYLSFEDIVGTPIFQRLGSGGTGWGNQFSNYNFKIQNSQSNKTQRGIEVFSYNYEQEILNRDNRFK